MISAVHLEPAGAPVRSGPRRGLPPAGDGGAEVRFTARADGDMADPGGADPLVAQRRLAVIDRPWTWLRQVHGARVIEVGGPGEGAAELADGAVSAAPGVALAVLTADCAPVALSSPQGVIGVAHAGWRGLQAGVIEATVAAMRRLGATQVVAALGPCIHAGCYRFGAAELLPLAARLGPAVMSRTSQGHPALDVPAAVRSALAGAEVELTFDADVCTACSSDYWSWRSRMDRERQATVVWRP